MPRIPSNPILEYHPDTLIVIRKEYNLDGPGNVEDSIRILREWVQKQPHFKKKDFNDAYLEIVIYACKGSLERAKKQIDRMCTVRTLLPHYFELRNPKTDFRYLFEAFKPVILPKLTPDHYRVFFIKANSKVHFIKDFLDYFVYDVMMFDYLKLHDYCFGYIMIVDLTEMNIMDFLAKLNLVHYRQLFTVLIEAYGTRLKGLHFYTSSKLIDALVTIVKQIVNPKISDRVHNHKNFEKISDIVPIDILPEEYGGKERSLEILCDQWVEIISSKENLNYLRDLNQAGTDESRRLNDKFHEEYAGMPGTFKVLSVD